MPKKDIDYSKTIIHRIVCRDPSITEAYIGHTSNFTKRKCEHKSRCNNENDSHYYSKIYQFIRNNGNWDHWDIIEVEKYPCNDSNEAKKRERYYIELYKPKLNTEIPGRTDKEYYTENFEKIQNKRKEYRTKNKETINEKSKEYTNNNKNKRKEYYENNKEKILQKMKENYQLKMKL